MTEIYVIRHVQAEGNLYRHMQGHWDGDVTALGRRQRDALAERFRDISVDAVYSSDLYRARFTATSWKLGISLKYMASRMAWSRPPSPEARIAARTIAHPSISLSKKACALGIIGI